MRLLGNETILRQCSIDMAASVETSWNTRQPNQSNSLLVHDVGDNHSSCNNRLSEAEREVQALLDKPCTQESNSDVVKRVLEKQKEKYDRVLADLQHELSTIHKKVQEDVRKVVDDFKKKQENSLQVMKTTVSDISSCKEQLSDLCMSDIEGVWQGVESQLDLRLKTIEELNKQLNNLEDERSQQVGECLSNYSNLLVGVAYCNQRDVVEEEAHSHNITIVSNKQSAAHLCEQLATAEYIVCEEMKTMWEGEVKRWRECVLNDVLTRFKGFIGVGEGVVKGRMESIKKKEDRIKEEMITELLGLHHWKLELLTQLSSHGPSTVVMETLHHIQETTDNIDQQMRVCMNRQLMRLGHNIEEMCCVCEEEMELCKKTLIMNGICDSSNVYQILNVDYLPLTEELAASARKELQNIESATESHIIQQQSWFHTVLQYGIGASEVWKEYSSKLSEIKRSRNEILEQVRSEHDIRNQNVEANLDIVLDHMRQAPNEQVLDQCLKEATKLFKLICTEYEEFHDRVVCEVEVWPAGVMGCVEEYDRTLCLYLGVNRQPTHSSPVNKRKSKVSSRSKAGSRRSKKTTPTSSTHLPHPPSMSSIVEEVVVRGRVVKYYLTSDPTQTTDNIFLTQNEESEVTPHVIANQALPLNKDIYQKAQTSLRACYLSHLEIWKKEMEVEEEREMKEKREETHSEIDLRLHLHRPRLTRITHDIHNVRAAELMAHRDRVCRHAKAVIASLNDIKTISQRAPDDMMAQENEYCQEMERLIASLSESTSIVGLQLVEEKGKHLLEKRVQCIQDIASSLLATIDAAITDLISSNTTFRQSLKLFSEAGNYCPEEVDLFSHKLDRLTNKISTAQPQITTTVITSSIQYIDNARETFTHFQNIYQFHWTDISYMEEVQRSLTNLQLLIRSEVANSNSQASKIHDNIIRLESGDSTLILDGLPLLVSLCTKRINYLHCLATLQQGGRVGGERLALMTQPISAVNITKSIREYTNTDQQQPTTTRHTLPPIVKDTGRKTGTMSRKKIAAVIVERKNVIFGTGGGIDRDCFLPRIRALLSTQYSKIYTNTEVYYNVKGSRSVTDSYEEALDKLIAKCHTYRTQCEEYRNNAITEFRGQLDEMMLLMVGVAPLVMDGVKDSHMIRWRNERETMSNTQHQTMEDLVKRKLLNEQALYPGLGHPSASTQLKQLQSSEETRHSECMDSIKQHMTIIQSCIKMIGRELVIELMSETERLIALCDTLPTTHEMIPGHVQKTEVLVNEILRMKLRPNDTINDTVSTSPSMKGRQWCGIPDDDILDLLQVNPSSSEREQLTRGVNSKKINDGHYAVMNARDKVLQEFVACLKKEVECIERWEREEGEKEIRWWNHWTLSIHSLTQLYYTTNS